MMGACTLLDVQFLSEFQPHEKGFFRFRLSYAYAPSVSFNCFAYSSSGTPNFLAIATCEGVSLTVLRLDFVVRLAEATCWTGLAVSVDPVVPNLWGNSS